MLKRIVIIVSVLIIIVLFSYILFQYFYLIPVKTEAYVEFNKKEREVITVLKYPLPRNYFLKNFEITPNLEGEYIFEERLKTPLQFLGYKEIRFKPKKIEFEQTYKVKNFDKEFSFALPSPKPRSLSFIECSVNSKICQRRGSIVITFFDPIEEDYFLEKFKLYRCKAQKCERIFRNIKKYSFSDSNKKIIVQVDPIENDVNYKTEILGKDLSFKIESPKTKSIFFSKAKQEITIIFTRPIEKKYFFENFKTTPSLEGRFIFDDSGTKVIFRPYEIKETRSYRVEILGRVLKINTKPLSPPKPQISYKQKFIEVDISKQRLWLYQKGKVIAEYITSTGAWGTPTPTGTFRVLAKEKNHWSATYRLYMPYSLRFYNGYFIHELPYWPGGYREGEAHLGTPVSHGCIRLGIGAAGKVYNFVSIGTKLVIHK